MRWPRPVRASQNYSLLNCPPKFSLAECVWRMVALHLMVQIRPAYAAHAIGTLCVVPQGHVLIVADTGRSHPTLDDGNSGRE